jgi:hypothetical protein
VELGFKNFQVVDSLHGGDVGRWRGENLEENVLYLKCRDGREDPQKFFASFEQAQKWLADALEWMWTREVRSSTGRGRWVPLERWEADVRNAPLVRRPAEERWVCAPERRTLKVSQRAVLTARAVGWHGVVLPLRFTAPWLWEYKGRTVDLFFDPMGQWPVVGTVADPKTRKRIGEVFCQDAFGASVDADVEMCKAIRRTMMSELRVIVGGKRAVREVRTPDGVGVREREGEDLRFEDLKSHNDFPGRSGGECLPAGRGEVAGRGRQDHEPRQITVAARENDFASLRGLARRAEVARQREGNW